MADLTHELTQITILRPRGWNKNILALFKKWHQNSVTRRQLKDLPEHLLEDIGIDKRAAKEEANKPWWK
ncbi:DUF1127 domain-containing protein [Vibrio hannami]|uniref:DUF1127 domain-containing protein n=1 Tax=Vibrio hannami TaxID=2717094 RepID=UPI00240EEA16|nr:DUF1127 domain-containing protein [Vibrio hannami]MDG3085905.1 DUF1127 domain-containing protein [Vibrio hannami]